MTDFFRILGIVNLFVAVALWVVFFRRFIVKIRALEFDESNEECEKQRGKSFFAHLYAILAINAASFTVAVGNFVGNYFAMGRNIPFYTSPIIVLLVGGMAICIILSVVFALLAKKYKIKNYDFFRQKLVHIYWWHKDVFGLCFFIGYLFSFVFAAALYFLLLFV